MPIETFNHLNRSIMFGLFVSLTIFKTAAANDNLPYDEDPINVGQICVSNHQGSERKAMSELRRLGAKVVRKSESDEFCHFEETPAALIIQDGLEGWSVNTLKQLGYKVGFASSTAGGSGDIRLRLKPGSWFKPKVTPQNMPSIRREIQCRINTAYEAHFESVNIRPCNYLSFDDGLCWQINVFGHTSTSSAFNRESLNNLISDKYWFRAEIGIWMGYFPNYQIFGGTNYGPTLKTHISVIESEFARSPIHHIPENDEYKVINHYNPTTDIFELDEAMNFRVADILYNSSRECRL